MDLRNCRKCDRMYGHDGMDLCPKCRSNDSEELKIIKDYLYDNPKASIKNVSDDTGVNSTKILKFLREEKIEIAEGSENMILDCERCGKAIRSGKFCDYCVQELKSELKSVADSMKKPEEKRKTVKSSGADKLFVASRHKR
jgi:flagellar operon protein (TIGR03826 family)